MKKIFYALLLLGASCSCSKSENAGNYDLSDLNASITDARIIYKRSAATAAASSAARPTRAETGNTYWKIDYNGKEQQVEIVDKDGSVALTEIRTITKVTDNLLYMSIGNPVNRNVLVSKSTGKIYLAPDDFYGQPMQEDNAGMLYYRGRSNSVTRLDPKAFTTSSYLPQGQGAEFFLISGQGSCLYNFNGAKIKCRDGAIVGADPDCFRGSDKNFYQLLPLGEGNQVVKLDESAPNTITVDEAKALPCHPFFDREALQKYIVNPKTGKTVFFSGYAIFEMGELGITLRAVHEEAPNEIFQNGETIDLRSYKLNQMQSVMLRDFAARLRPLYSYNGFEEDKPFFSSDKLYMLSNSQVFIVNMDTYEMDAKGIPDVEIYSLSASPSSNKLIFSGMQYSTGHIVVGEYAPDGTVTITSSTDTTDKIENLICLN